MLSVEKKIEIFSFIKENISIDFEKDEFSSLTYVIFNNDTLMMRGFSIFGGMTKACLYHEVFGEYVAKFRTVERDYCEKEYQNYLLAKDNGLEKYFPYTDFLGEFCNIKFFIQEKAICNDDYISDQLYKNMYESYVGEPDLEELVESGYLADVVSDMDDEERLNCLYGCDCDDLIEFVNEYRINDLYEGNFGYIDNRLVIIDFSGFRGLE